MSKKGRNSYSKEFKSKVALEAIKGQKTNNELATEFSLHVSQINLWKQPLLEGLPGVFSHRPGRMESEFEAERDLLYRQIGKLQVEVDGLTKKTGHLK